MCGTLFHNAAEGNMLYAPSKLATAHVEPKLLAFSPPRPADEGDDGDAHEQHRADRHAGDDGGQGAVGSEHVVVKPAEDVANAHEGSDDGGAGERDGAPLQLADAPNLGELRINLMIVMRTCLPMTFRISACASVQVQVPVQVHRWHSIKAA